MINYLKLVSKHVEKGWKFMNKLFLHGEGFVVLLSSLYLYEYNDFSWLWFIIFIFIPDLSMIGYLINNKIGAILYNIIHTYSLSIALAMYGFLLSNSIVLGAGLILSAHIGMDRMLGLGLKYPTTFKDTHLNRV